MIAEETKLDGVFLLQPKVFGDSRGFFLESWNQREFQAATGADVSFVQDNHSCSSRGVLRGLHIQLPPHAQGKLVRVVAGSVFDVAVDVNPNSPTFCQWVGFELSAENHKQLWIPAGYAHGFLTLSERAEMLYKATEFYAPEVEKCIRWDDNELGINWPILDRGELCLSDKDKNGLSMREFVDQLQLS